MGLTIRQIIEHLAKQGYINPKTERPWQVATIHKDLTILEAEWRAHALKDTGEHRARLLHELSEVKRRAYMTKKYSVVLTAIERECKILGTDAPQEIKVYIQQHEEFRQRIFRVLGKLSPEIQAQFIEALEGLEPTEIPPGQVMIDLNPLDPP